MSQGRSVLLMDASDARMTGIGERLRRLDFRVLHAKTPEEALRLAADRRFDVGAALIPPELPVADLAQALGALRARVVGGDLAYVVTGARPDAAAVARLRAAYVRLALWEPFADGRLRFQVNRALAGLRPPAPRRELRIPAELPVQLWSGGRRKTARAYTLSAAGAFLETPRPSPFGASLSLELSLDPEPIAIEARVVYTNVPGNLRKSRLPVGMAVAFMALPEHARQAIRERVEQTTAALRL